jgi:ABC-type glycerol-3-phosphate transport system permease component
MIVTSVKPNDEIFSMQAPLVVQHATIQHYTDLLSQTLFGNWFLNSVIVSVVTTLIGLLLGSLAAYGVARTPSSVTSSLARVVLLVYLIPRAVLFIPLYQVLNALGLLDNLLGLIIAYLSFTLPFCIWLLIGYFKAIPKELDEAALIDGATPLGVLWRVIIPIGRPALVVVSIFAFSMSWNEFMYPLVFIQSSSQQPITAGIAGLQQGDVFSWGQLMAAGTLAAIPIVIIYSLIQKHIANGLTAGAVKG